MTVHSNVILLPMLTEYWLLATVTIGMSVKKNIYNE
jgi:hypothetical protein